MKPLEFWLCVILILSAVSVLPGCGAGYLIKCTADRSAFGCQ